MTILSSRSTSVTFALVFTIGLLIGKSYLVLGGGLIFTLCALPWFVMLFWRHPLFLVFLWPVLLLINVLFPFAPFLFHGFSLLPMDLAIIFTVVHLIISAALRRKDLVRGLKENPFLSLFIVVIGVYIVICTPLYGKSAIGEARKHFSFFLFPLFTMVSIKETKDLRRLISVVLFVSAFISIVALLKIYPSKSVYKIVNAEGCLILILAALSILLFHMNGIVVTNRIIDAVMLVLFPTIVLISRHRSVWLAGAFGFFLLLGLHRERVLSFARVGMASILIFGLLVTAVIVTPEFGSSLKRSFRGIIDPYSDNTASWRIRGWQQQIGRIVRTKKALLGEGIGGYYSWRDRGTEVKVSPHNAYVQLFLKFGFTGLTIYGFLVFKFFRETIRVRNKLPPSHMKAYMETGMVNVGAAHAYMMAYDFSLIMLIFIGLAMSAAKLQWDSWAVSKMTKV